MAFIRNLSSIFVSFRVSSSSWFACKTTINTEMQLQAGPPELIKKRIANKRIGLACIPKAKTLSEQSLNRFRVWKSGRKNIKPIIMGKIKYYHRQKINIIMGKMKCNFRDKMSDTHHDNVRDEEGHSSIIEKPPNVNSACKNTLDGV